MNTPLKPQLHKHSVMRSAFVKTYVLTVSIAFPKSHKRAGEPTYFKEQILTALMEYEKGHGLKEKKHTIRSNYQLWVKRIKEVQEGKAVLSIRHWSGKPYNSKQVEICQLDKNSGIGIQALYFEFERFLEPFVSSEDSKNGTQTYLSTHEIAINDGLIYPDFQEWFKHYKLNEPMAIIHFTKMRY